MRVGVIGAGFVGAAVYRGFKKLGAGWHDLDPFKLPEGYVTFDEVAQADYVFVCVPTPSLPNGQCDISIVADVVHRLQDAGTKQIVLKSTVPPGTTALLGADVVFNPEFLTERNANKDFRSQQLVFGGDPERCVLVKRVYQEAQIGYPWATYIMDSTSAELVKYMSNTFMAVQISLANEFKQLADRLHANYDEARKPLLRDNRIGTATEVPGYDGQLGWGGHCFPKDTAAIRFLARQLDVPMPTLDGALLTNRRVRNAGNL